MQLEWQGTVVVFGTYPSWSYDVLEKNTPGYCPQVKPMPSSFVFYLYEFTLTEIEVYCLYFWPPLKGSLPCRPRHPWCSNHLADRNPWLPHLKHLHRPGRGGQDLRSSRNKQEVDLSGRSQPCPDHHRRHYDWVWHRLQGGVQQRRHRVLGHRRLHHHRRQHRPHRLLHLRQLGPLRQPHLTDRVIHPQNPALYQGHLAIGWDHRCNLGENYLKFFSAFSFEGFCGCFRSLQQLECWAWIGGWKLFLRQTSFSLCFCSSHSAVRQCLWKKKSNLWKKKHYFSSILENVCFPHQVGFGSSTNLHCSLHLLCRLQLYCLHQRLSLLHHWQEVFGMRNLTFLNSNNVWYKFSPIHLPSMMPSS